MPAVVDRDDVIDEGSPKRSRMAAPSPLSWARMMKVATFGVCNICSRYSRGENQGVDMQILDQYAFGAASHDDVSTERGQLGLMPLASGAAK